MPDLALLNACWEQDLTSESGILADLLKDVKNSSKVEEIVFLMLERSNFIMVQNGSFPLFRVNAPFRRRDFSKTSGSKRVEQTIEVTASTLCIWHLLARTCVRYNEGSFADFGIIVNQQSAEMKHAALCTMYSLK